MSNFDLEGKRCVVVGGTRGIGRSLAELLVSSGADVALCGRDQGRTQTACQQLRSVGSGVVHGEALDVAASGSVEGFVERSVSVLGGLDGVVACAGGARGRGLGEASGEEWAATWELNAGYSSRLLAAAVPHLKAAGGGSAVLVSSISGWKPSPQAQYGAAKAAQIAMAASLARELGPFGIRVNAVSPGSTLVPGKRWDRMRQQSPKEFTVFTGEFPGGRLVEPDEVARVIAFLLSDLSSGISGANVPVDRAQNAPSAEGY